MLSINFVASIVCSKQFHCFLLELVVVLDGWVLSVLSFPSRVSWFVVSHVVFPNSPLFTYFFQTIYILLYSYLRLHLFLVGFYDSFCFVLSCFCQVDISSGNLRRKDPNWEDAPIRLACGQVHGTIFLVKVWSGRLGLGWVVPCPCLWPLVYEKVGWASHGKPESMLHCSVVTASGSDWRSCVWSCLDSVFLKAIESKQGKWIALLTSSSWQCTLSYILFT